MLFLFIVGISPKLFDFTRPNPRKPISTRDYSDKSVFELYECLFSNVDDGSALNIKEGTDKDIEVYIYGTIFTVCKADEGAAIYIEDSTLAIFRMNNVCAYDCYVSESGSIMHAVPTNLKEDFIINYLTTSKCRGKKRSGKNKIIIFVSKEMNGRKI